MLGECSPDSTSAQSNATNTDKNVWNLCATHPVLTKHQQRLFNHRALKRVAGKVIDAAWERPPHPCFHIFLWWRVSPRSFSKLHTHGQTNTHAHKHQNLHKAMLFMSLPAAPQCCCHHESKALVSELQTAGMKRFLHAGSRIYLRSPLAVFSTARKSRSAPFDLQADPRFVSPGGNNVSPCRSH